MRSGILTYHGYTYYDSVHDAEDVDEVGHAEEQRQEQLAHLVRG